MNNFTKIMASFFFLGFIAIGCFLYWKNLGLLNKGVRVVGEVVSFDVRKDKEKTSYFPAVKFELENGTTQFDTLKQGSNPKMYEVGDSINLIYDKDDIDTVIINSFFWIYIFPNIFIFAGTFMLYFFIRR